MKRCWLCHLLYGNPIFASKLPLNRHCSTQTIFFFGPEQPDGDGQAVLIFQEIEISGVGHVGYGHDLVSKLCRLTRGYVTDDADLCDKYTAKQSS